MTINEAIQTFKENAEKIGGNPQSDYHASCYKLIADWLSELQDTRALIKQLKRLVSITITDLNCIHLYEALAAINSYEEGGEVDKEVLP